MKAYFESLLMYRTWQTTLLQQDKGAAWHVFSNNRCCSLFLRLFFLHCPREPRGGALIRRPENSQENALPEVVESFFKWLFAPVVKSLFNFEFFYPGTVIQKRNTQRAFLLNCEYSFTALRVLDCWTQSTLKTINSPSPLTFEIFLHQVYKMSVSGLACLHVLSLLRIQQMEP